MAASNYAIVEDGFVVNIVVWDGDIETWQPPEGCVAHELAPEDAVSIGYAFDGTSFMAPTGV